MKARTANAIGLTVGVLICLFSLGQCAHIQATCDGTVVTGIGRYPCSASAPATKETPDDPLPRR